jgi:hypothetical protein
LVCSSCKRKLEHVQMCLGTWACLTRCDHSGIKLSHNILKHFYVPRKSALLYDYHHFYENVSFTPDFLDLKHKSESNIVQRTHFLHWFTFSLGILTVTKTHESLFLSYENC